VIKVDRVTKRFGTFLAVDNVSIEIARGSLTALLGPSGSGKSTLLRIIAGLEVPDSGEVWLGDRDVSRMPPQERGVGFVFQHYAAFKHMTVFDNVAFGLTIGKKRSKAEIAERVQELLALVQIEPFADRYPNQLSGGQRQRMALARALAVRPEVLLLDEPFGALDARVRKELRSWLRSLHEETGVTTVFVTHDQEEAMDAADQIVVLDHGRIQQIGSPRSIYERPANEFVMSFIGPVNRLGASWVRPHDIDILLVPNESAVEALVQRVVYLGFEVRVELVRADGQFVSVQLPRAEAEMLELGAGQIVHVRAGRGRVFADSATDVP
jgi:sulfate transport system ATP-binding protein